MLHLNYFFQMNVLIVFQQGSWKNIISQVQEKDNYGCCSCDYLVDHWGIGVRDCLPSQVELAGRSRQACLPLQVKLAWHSRQVRLRLK